MRLINKGLSTCIVSNPFNNGELRTSTKDIDMNQSLRFAEVLAEAREAKGISQNALARSLGMDASHLNRIERGLRNPPSREKVLAISEVLELAPEEQTRLLVAAGYAPEDVRGLASIRANTSRVSEWKEPSNPEVKSLRRASPEVMQIIQSLAEEVTSLVDNTAVPPRTRRVLLSVLEAQVDFVRVLRNRILAEERSSRPPRSETRTTRDALEQPAFSTESTAALTTTGDDLITVDGLEGNLDPDGYPDRVLRPIVQGLPDLAERIKELRMVHLD